MLVHSLLALALCSFTVQTAHAKPNAKAIQSMTVTKKPFGTASGTQVDLYNLSNGRGMTASIATYGGIVVSLEVLDKQGRSADVVLGFPTIDGYLKGHPYFGAIVGRYGNRIAKGRFALDNKTYNLAKNNGENHLHGGASGFDKAVWAAKEIIESDASGIRLSHVSKAGDEGYPGTLTAVVEYRVTADNALDIRYEASTDSPTPINLTHHSYFNLAGKGDILGHELQLEAPFYTPIDSGLIPTGEIASVAGTPFDFRMAKPIGSHISEKHEQLAYGKGYDHNFVLSHPEGVLGLAATVREKSSGRVMRVYTTEPGLQFYSGNFLDGSLTGKDGQAYTHRTGFCLETQHFPDSPNKPHFPSSILRPSETYRHHTRYVFSVN